MKKLPEFKSKPIKGVNEEDWGKLTVGYFNKLDSRYASNDFLLFDLERIYELAKPFTNAQQMIDFKGENEKLINSAGRYIQYEKVSRPDWFDVIYEAESLEECLEIASKFDDYKEFRESNPRIHQRLFWLLGTKEMKIRLRKLNSNMKFIQTNKTDDEILEILLKYPTTRELRKDKENKKFLTKLQVDKGKKYPKSYNHYQTMTIDPKDQKRPKRSNYGQRDPLIQQYTLEGELLGEFTWAQIKEMGYNRSTVTGALKGTNGQKTAYKFIWKYKV